MTNSDKPSDAIEATSEAIVEHKDTQLPPFFRELDVVFRTVVAVLLFVLVACVGANIVGRFVFGHSLTWADELSRFIFAWVIFLGAALAYFRDEHISARYFVNFLPPRAREIASLASNVIVLAVVVVLAWGSWQLLVNFSSRSPVLGIPLSWVNVSVSIGIVLMAAMCLHKIASNVRRISKRDA